MSKWQVQEAKARFSELVDKTVNEGPQVITRYGEDVVVLISREQFEQFSRRKPTLLEVLTSGPKFEDLEEIIGPRDDYGRKVDL